jgi:hypothetical protein
VAPDIPVSDISIFSFAKIVDDQCSLIARVNDNLSGIDIFELKIDDR